MTIDKSLLLQETEIYFEILQEYSEDSRHGRVVLGQVKLNLAEYADRTHLEDDTSRDPDDEGITRRYLMQNSKINSTLKIGIALKQLEGDTNFTTPPLKSAMVFGGIAGIVSADATTDDMNGNIPTISSKTRELSELQDIYRRTLAATWACQAGELPPDKLVEDLFSGGDGGHMRPPEEPVKSGWRRRHAKGHGREESAGSGSDAESRRTVTPPHSMPSGQDDMFGPAHPRRSGSVDEALDVGRQGPHSHLGGVSGRASIDQQMQSARERRPRVNSNYREYSEFVLRENLRSWSVDVRHEQRFETGGGALKAG
jgi:hypothetical protein